MWLYFKLHYEYSAVFRTPRDEVRVAVANDFTFPYVFHGALLLIYTTLTVSIKMCKLSVVRFQKHQ